MSKNQDLESVNLDPRLTMSKLLPENGIVLGSDSVAEVSNAVEETLASGILRAPAPVPPPIPIQSPPTQLSDKKQSSRNFRIGLIIGIHLITVLLSGFEILKMYQWNDGIRENDSGFITMTIFDFRYHDVIDCQHQYLILNNKKDQIRCCFFSFENQSFPDPESEDVAMANKITTQAEFSGFWNNFRGKVYYYLRPGVYYPFGNMLFPSILSVLAGIAVFCRQNEFPSKKWNCMAQATLSQDERDRQNRKRNAMVRLYVVCGWWGQVVNCIQLISILFNDTDNILHPGQAHLLNQGYHGIPFSVNINQLCSVEALVPLKNLARNNPVTSYNCLVNVGACPNRRYLAIYLGVIVLEVLLTIPVLVIPFLKSFVREDDNLVRGLRQRERQVDEQHHGRGQSQGQGQTKTKQTQTV